jgi:hypothetical protein
MHSYNTIFHILYRAFVLTKKPFALEVIDSLTITIMYATQWTLSSRNLYLTMLDELERRGLTEICYFIYPV